MKIEPFSFGVGDRFGREAGAQLEAIRMAHAAGAPVAPVWNKSNREHKTVGSDPAAVRERADAAVAAAGWNRPYHVDADHIGLTTVDPFLACSDFFTIDVADAIGKPPDPDGLSAYMDKGKTLARRVSLPNRDEPITLTAEEVERTATHYLHAVREAGRVYRYIRDKREEPFIVEVSMDETERAQTPAELLVILHLLSWEMVPVQTIAPKFSGRFNKGVDYVGDLAAFRREFADDLAVVRFAVEEFGCPRSLKLSVHSGSDKFSLYPIIREEIRRVDAGIHVKTAGTTWLEELLGLALAGGDGLRIAREVYTQAHARFDELVAPYATVTDIRRDALPEPATVAGWDGATYADSLRHDQANPRYNPSFRQTLHVAYKVAAEMGDEFLHALDTHRDVVRENVIANIHDRHLKPIFLDG